MTAAAIVRAESLVKQHEDRNVVDGVSLTIAKGESVALMGASGGGKTTLLHMLGLLEHPTRGRVLIDGVDAWQLSSEARAALRLTRIGFVFQQSNLLPHISVRYNVALPAWRLTGNRRAALQRAEALLDDLGLRWHRKKPGGVLSLGEAQRVAVARALVNGPALIIADEPTGSLDSHSAAAVLSAFERVRSGGTAILLATHDPLVATRMQRQLYIRDGRLENGPAPDASMPAPEGL